jgi:lysophospholipase L1-like esterase
VHHTQTLTGKLRPRPPLACWLKSGSILLGAWLLFEAAMRRVPGQLPEPVQAITGRRPRSWHRSRRFYQGWHKVQIDDPELGNRYEPNLDIVLTGHPDFCYRLRTNSRGLRTSCEHGPVDIVMVGDSFTYGYGVDQEKTWVAQLAQLSGQRCANLGISGIGPQRELRLLTTEGLRLQPQQVVWQFFPNDFLDASLFERWRDSGQEESFLAWQRRQQGPSPRVSPGGASFVNLRGMLHRHLLSYELAKYWLALGPYGQRDQQPVWVRSGALRLLLDPAANRRWADPSQPAILRGREITYETLRQASRLARSAQAGFTVLLAPSKEVVYRHLLPSFATRQWVALVQESNRQLIAFCRAAGIPCLDLTETFSQAARAGQMLYFAQDAHWNPAGHRLAAREVAEFLALQHLSSRLG